jgi:3-oxoacyl-[acyl-carrier-protein] synthase-3
MLYLHGVGHFHPETSIDNHFLESLDIGTNSEWILARTGIRTRRTVLPLSYIRDTRNRDPLASEDASLYSNAETSFRAASLALARAGIRAQDVGLVVAGGSAPRISSPAEACVIADRLGITAPALDLNSACSTFAVQLRTLLSTRADSLPDYVLVVNPENLTRSVDYSDRNTAVLMGDCTTAAIVSARVPSRAAVLDSFHQSDPAGWSKVTISLAGYLSQDGAAVQNFAIRKSIAVIESLRSTGPTDHYFIGHQANLLMLQSVCNRAGVASDRHLFNVDRQGNCGAAGAPSVLSENWDSFQPGDSLIIAVVGAGLTWAGLKIQFLDSRTA